MAYAAISKPSLHFDTRLYTGAGSNLTVSDLGFQPDWAWFKKRNGSAGHELYDALRGVQVYLASNSNNGNDTNTNGLTAFNSGGWTVGGNGLATSGNWASWNWKANGQGSSNTSGSINSTYTSANTTAGFSIVTYTGNGSAGATIGHGLGAKPDCMLVKQLTGSNVNWRVYLGSDANYHLQLNSTAAESNDNSIWNDTEPTSTVFTVGSSTSTNGNGVNYVAYLFTSIKGYSKFDKYTGNASTNGPMINTGFKPAWVMMKNVGSTGNWWMFDNKRQATYNTVYNELLANSTDTEDSAGSASLDFLSNGIKIRTTQSDINGNGGTFAYMCFAESPFVANVGADGVPTTAR